MRTYKKGWARMVPLGDSAWFAFPTLPLQIQSLRNSKCGDNAIPTGIFITDKSMPTLGKIYLMNFNTSPSSKLLSK